MNDEDKRIEKYARAICEAFYERPDFTGLLGRPRWKYYTGKAKKLMEVIDKEIEESFNEGYEQGRYQ